MGLRDILKKKDRLEVSKENRREDAVNRLAAPEFTFIRSDTNTQEIIHPPGDDNSPHDGHEPDSQLSVPGTSSRPRRVSDAFRSSSNTNNNNSSPAASSRDSSLHTGPSPVRRISQRLRLSRAPASSDNVPADLPEIITTSADLDNPAADKDGNDTELQWEKRATILAKTANENEALHRSAPASPAGPLSPALELSGFPSLRIVGEGEGRTDATNGVASTPTIDADIQQAITLHEKGELEQSTALFGVLADPKGANNPLSQVLYGLALR